MRILSRPYPILSLLLLAIHSTSSVSADKPPNAVDYKAEADALMAQSDMLGASRAYTRAIDADHTSWNLYYRRATTYLSLGRNSQALDDLDNVIRLNPTFISARLQKGKVLAKEGEFAKAKKEVVEYLKVVREDAAALELQKKVNAAEISARGARAARDRKKYDLCVESATKALETGSNAVELRELRLECEEALGDTDAVIGDLIRLSSLKPSNIPLSLRLTLISYFFSEEPSQALTHIKQCLHYDPDSKPCKAIHKLLRSIEKDTTRARNFVDGREFRSALKILVGSKFLGGEGDGLIGKLQLALDGAVASGDILEHWNPNKRSSSRLGLYRLACRAYAGLAQAPGIKIYCEEVLGMEGGEADADALSGKADVLMQEERWEEAVRVLSDAFEQGGRSDHVIMEKLQKAQRLLKQSKAKDYYKVLGVSRDADPRTIKKAYRNAAKIAHPDKGGSEEKMASLNEAYEVLSNEELRNRFDNGDDPNDPQTGHQQQHNPFAHHGGGFPFHGGNPFQGQQGGHGQKFHFQWGQ